MTDPEAKTASELGTPQRKETPKGIINPALVRRISFAIISISLFVSVTLCVLAIWNFTSNEAIWRAIATFVVISFGTFIFSVINEKFG